ncbi:MAG: 4-(cytidine 5'-diphospho)-2-C-methyl-D-erythritol kinase [Defluviitaleaceae bacterium]|nr:4-(cytidine 5'-diphospho)-2-C-methyl-D-erythritol kinase [Defluviitaleaceae bacterium]
MKAFSKINLILEVLERRPDGYHNLRSVMQSLDLHDLLTIRCETPARDKPFLQLECSDPVLPADERNLVYRAADYMVKTYGIRQSIHIRVDKRIPIAAGLGGGSSDCAAALVGMNQLFALGLTAEELRGIGLRFGADVPFCITGGTMLAEGVGEILTELPPHPPCWIVLACLPISVSTAEIFKRFGEGGNLCPTRAQVGGGTCPLVGDKLKSDGGLTSDLIGPKLKNDLTPVTAALHPEINGLIDRMKRLGASDASMSGSGPSVFGLFDSESAARAAAHTLNGTIKNVYITRPERMRSV